ncbi:hypothetical protein V1264_016879 [Littorina saxatilis]|uniref:Uncharacterized protein n=2 Tax=Littorina saxatilis TaxID=31220 RepID=A0AAN9GE01_9CAEN
MMNVTIHCFLLKSAFPSQCNPGHENKTKFRHSPDGQNFVDVCTLSDILGECTSSGPCECDAANATHHMFHYTFEVNKSRQGDWDCLVPCWVGAVPLTFGQVDCDNKKVFDVNNVTDLNNVTDAESSSSPSCFVFGLSAAGGACVTVAAVAGVYCIMERKSGGQQKAPSAVAAPQNIFPENIPPAEFSPANAPPDNGPQVAGSTGPPTGPAVPIIPYDKPDEPSVTGSDASEGVEGSDVDIFSAPFQ